MSTLFNYLSFLALNRTVASIGWLRTKFAFCSAIPAVLSWN